MAVAGAIRAGGAFVELFADPRNLAKGLKEAQAKVQNFGASLSGIGKTMSMAGGAITAPLLGAAKLFADSGSALHDMSQRTGVSVEALSMLGYAAKQSGTDMEGVEVGIRKMQKSLTAGTEENQAAIESFAMLGLSVEKLARLSPEQQFEAIGKSILRVKDETIRGGLAMQVFGRSGENLIPLFMDLDKSRAEAEKFGLVMSTGTAEAADKLGDSLDLLHSVLASITKAVGASLAPLLTEWSIQLATLGKQVKDFINDHKPMIVLVFKVGAALTIAGAAFVALGTVISGVGTVLGVFSGMFTAIAAGLALLVSPLGLITAGFIGMTTYMVKTGQASTQNLGMIKNALGSLLAEVQTTFGGIADALKAGDIKLAGQILWAGLNVEFLKGLNYIKGLWADWGVEVLNVFTGLKFNIASWIVDVQASFGKGWTMITGDLNDAFVWVIGQVKIAWGAFTNFLMNNIDQFVANTSVELINIIKEIKTQIALVKGIVTGGAGEAIFQINKEAEKAIGEVRATQEQRKTGRAKEQEQRVAAPGQEILANQAERAKTLQGIEASRVGAQGVLESDKKAEIEARRKAAQDVLASGKGDLEKAQKELADLNLNARVAAAKGMQPVGMPLGAKAGPDLSSLGFEPGFQVVKGEAKGSFSAGALGGLGAGETIQNDQLKEMKKQNENLQTIGRKIDRAKPVWS